MMRATERLDCVLRKHRLNACVCFVTFINFIPHLVAYDSLFVRNRITFEPSFSARYSLHSLL